jgi:hypothetical protein
MLIIFKHWSIIPLFIHVKVKQFYTREIQITQLVELNQLKTSTFKNKLRANLEDQNLITKPKTRL